MNIECGAISFLLVLCFILSIIGIVLIYSIVGILVGIVLMIVAWIFLIIAVIIVLVTLYNNGFKNQPIWCKINIIVCIVLFVILISFAIAGSVEQNKYKQIVPMPENEETTMPSNS